MNLNIVKTTLTSIASAVQSFRAFTSDYTLTDAASLTRVEPLTITSKDCINLEYMPDVMNSTLSLFAGYYLQAVSILTKVNHVEVIKILDKLNPNRSDVSTLGTESYKYLSQEHYQHKLPTSKNVALEVQDVGLGNDGVYQITNLSVGKLLNIDISLPSKDTETKSVKVPVSVRLMVSPLSSQTISHILTSRSTDKSFTERFHAWRSGRITFFKDLVFCQDLIDEYKKSAIEDQTNTVQEMLRRVNAAKKYGVMTQNISYAASSNVFVISETDAREIEHNIGGKLSNAATRSKLFKDNYVMILVVVDRERELVTFYSRGLSAGTTLTVKEIKGQSKGKGPDIFDILKNYNMGSQIAF